MGRLTWPIVFLSDDLDTHKDWDKPHQIMVTLVGREEENLFLANEEYALYISYN